MNEKEKQVKKELIATTKAVKKKFQELQSDKLLLDERLEEKYKPITKSLKKIIENQKDDTPFPQEKTKDFNETEFVNSSDEDDDEFFDASTINNESPTLVEDKEENIVTDDDDDNNGINTKNYKIDWVKYNNILLSKDSDTQYGVRKSDQSLKIGNYVVKFLPDKIVIRKQNFPITRGLLDLLFYKKPPKGYTKADLQHYKDIIILTNAHKKHFGDQTPVRHSKKNYKYTQIIAPLLKIGSGFETDFMSVNNNLIDYSYWDDPNELVERLKLLVSSSSAGHTGHNNEIISIIEELREANIIE